MDILQQSWIIYEGKEKIMFKWFSNIKLWLVSQRTAHCRCWGIRGCTFWYRPASFVQIDMIDITVTKPMLIECDVCHCEFILSTYGVAVV